MKKFLTYLVVVLVFATGMLRLSLEFEAAQDAALSTVARAAQGVAAGGLPEPDGLRVLVCGSSSPLPAPGKAQACLAVLTPYHFYIVDSGAGSTANLVAGRVPMERLQAVLLTHFHSDHIAEIPEINLNSWVAGRPQPLQVIGPEGIRQVVGGLNEVYKLDRGYRVEHHGAELLPPELGVLAPQRINSSWEFEDGDLKISAFPVDHSPVHPAVGYRFEYRGRSLVISGDSVVTDEVRAATNGADLVFHDALSLPIINALAEAADDVGRDRIAKILNDIMDYHASSESLIALSDQVGMMVYYHLVPFPQNIVMRKVFERNLPENYRLADDGDWFFLPADSDEIIVN